MNDHPFCKIKFKKRIINQDFETGSVKGTFYENEKDHFLPVADSGCGNNHYLPHFSGIFKYFIHGRVCSRPSN
jgi:hypothetical protein